MRTPVRLLSCLVFLAACAGPGSVRLPPLLPRAGGEPGWPFGESGRGPVTHLSEQADDEDYGWKPAHPIPLGGADQGANEVWARQRSFLNSLWGPGGQILFYERLGSCCPFDHPGAPLDRGTLDVYEVTWDGLQAPRHLYLDRFRVGEVVIPVDLTSRIPPG